jgi:hypothetical protein
LGILSWLGKKTVFFSHLYIKVIFLPRQARDKHRENSKQSPFSCRLESWLIARGWATLAIRKLVTMWCERKKRPLSSPCLGMNLTYHVFVLSLS